ncbi:RNA polymerase sigma factor [Neobacillus niacini]|uniref:RNA polymerase sigma factor n=1 Tax=Neobacillus niacini TaxID=86668 RepID=UPI0039835F06
MFDLENLEEKISEIYHLHYLDVYKFLVCFSGNQDEAEDMTQEVFIRVLKTLGSFNGTSSLKTWIFSIAKHVAIDHHRKKRFSSIFKEGFFKQMASKEKGPTEVVERNEMQQLVHEAISKLKPSYRAVVLLRGINEFSIKETAEILHCSESKVKVDYHRALTDLKKKLKFDVKEVMGNAK